MKTKTTYFGRCIFLSWYCEKGTCDFCFRSTIKHQIKHAENAKRSVASILTDAIIGKNLGWKIEFLTGGYGIFEFAEIVKIAKYVKEVYNEKIWVNIGALSTDEMNMLSPYVEGICASIETIEPKLHDKICPDKPINKYSQMLEKASELGFKTSITIVIGLGEKREDFELLKEYIKGHKLDRITFYALKPVKNTPYTKSPKIEDYTWWIKQTRENFPDLIITTGLTPKKVDYVKPLLEAGSNAITKFPAIKQFNSENAKLIEAQIKDAGREFTSTLTKMPDVDWGNEVDKLDLPETLKQSVKDKVNEYVKKMKSK